MALYAVAGCKFFIGGVLDEQDEDFVAADFTSQSWVEVKKWTQMGPIGDASQLVTSDIINVARTKKIKGTKNAGSMQNIFNVEDDDPGQIAMIAASQTANNYAFKIELNDTPPAGSAPTPSMRYFVGLVMTAQEQGGGANTVRAMDATVEINSNIVRVAATTGD